jgi:rubrerythrin
MFEDLSAFDVLEIALRIEANAVRFYQAAEKIMDNPAAASLLGQLAQWEQGHLRLVSDLKERLSRQVRDKAAYEARHVQNSDAQLMAGLAVFGIQSDPWPELSGTETSHDVFSLALKKERESVTFYNGLKDFVPRPADRQVIDRILQEENLHVKVLTDALKP